MVVFGGLELVAAGALFGGTFSVCRDPPAAREARRRRRVAEIVTRTRLRLIREGDRAASRQLLTTPESSPKNHRRTSSEADLEAIASQLNSPTDVADDRALFDESAPGRRLDKLLDDAERRRAYQTAWLPLDRDSSPLRQTTSAPTAMNLPVLGGCPED